MQIATLTVLTATFSVVIFVLLLSSNVRKVISAWGDTVQVTAYLREDIDEAATTRLQKAISALPEVANIDYIARESATAQFKTQMASYAPDLLNDADFANPFPASFRISLKGGVKSDEDLHKLEGVSAQIGKLDGVEDVSYGQSWVKNYSTFVSFIMAGAGIMIGIMLLGGLFVVGNSIRASISSRVEEIEILELVGATAGMIRRPYVSEGFLMGASAALSALVLNFGLHLWAKQALSASPTMARMGSLLSFLDPLSVLLAIAVGGCIGALGAWLTIRRMNDGWSASQRLEAR
jgi:cell division transport system permease protein